MTREAFYTWLHAIDYTTCPSEIAGTPGKGSFVMEASRPREIIGWREIHE